MPEDFKTGRQREIYRGKDEIHFLNDDNIKLLGMNEVKSIKGLRLRTDESGYPASIELDWIDKYGSVNTTTCPIPLRIIDQVCYNVFPN